MHLFIDANIFLLYCQFSKDDLEELDNPTSSAAVHAGSLIGTLKEAHRFLRAPPPYDFGGADRQSVFYAASPQPTRSFSTP
jgi:hypothetical protein